MGGVESLGISEVGQAVLAMLISGMTPACQLCGLMGEQFGKRTVVSSPLDARNFSFSYITFKLLPDHWSSEGVSLSR